MGSLQTFQNLRSKYFNNKGNNKSEYGASNKGNLIIEK